MHQLSGLLTGLVLMMVAFTGMSLHWHEPTKAVVEWLTGDDIVDASEPAAAGLAPIRDLDLAIALGRTVLPDVNLRHIRMPREAGDPVLLSFGATRQSVPTRVWVGDDPPRVIAVDDGRRASTGQWLWHLRYSLHVGDFAGPIVRALWVVVALLPVAFVATGIMLHFGRRRRRSRTGRHFSKNDSGATSSA